MIVHELATTTAMVHIKENTSTAKAILPWMKMAMKSNCSNAMDCHGKCLPLTEALGKKVSH